MTTTLDAPATTVRVAQYLRVSMDKSGEARSVDEQELDNQRAIEAQPGWRLIETYRDNDRSASRYARKVREDYARLVADLERAAAFDVLVLWESSRGSRKVSEWCRLIELCQERHVRVYVTSHGRAYDPTNARDERGLLEDAVDSQYESGKMSTRLKRSAAARARDGKPVGKVPFGYERIYDQHTKKFDEQRAKYPEADIVKEIFTKLAAGESLRAITKSLNDARVPTRTGVPWGSQVVRQIALSPTYIAKRVHQGVTTDAQWPPLVDLQTFYLVRRILTDPARTTRRPGKAKHLLSMIARCGVCEGPISVTYRLRNGIPSYVCKDSHHVGIDQVELDEYVTERVRLRLLQPRVWERLTAVRADDAAQVAAQGEVAAAQTRLEEFYSEASASGLSLRALGEIESDRVADLAAATAALAELTTPPALAFLAKAPREELPQTWAAASMAARREVVRTMAEIKVMRSPLRGHRGPVQERVALEWHDFGG